MDVSCLSSRKKILLCCGSKTIIGQSSDLSTASESWLWGSGCVWTQSVGMNRKDGNTTVNLSSLIRETRWYFPDRPLVRPCFEQQTMERNIIGWVWLTVIGRALYKHGHCHRLLMLLASLWKPFFGYEERSAIPTVARESCLGGPRSPAALHRMSRSSCSRRNKRQSYPCLLLFLTSIHLVEVPALSCFEVQEERCRLSSRRFEIMLSCSCVLCQPVPREGGKHLILWCRC